MGDPFIGDIRMFGGNFAPRGYALCDGQLLSISQNDALFSLFGTIYGGDGRTSFGLPDLRGRVPIHKGSGPGLSPRTIGRKLGAENVTLTVNELPSHGHPLTASQSAANSADPVGHTLAVAEGDVYNGEDADSIMGFESIGVVGGDQRHTNLQPFQVINFIVALQGVYPSWS